MRLSSFRTKGSCVNARLDIKIKWIEIGKFEVAGIKFSCELSARKKAPSVSYAVGKEGVWVHQYF